MMVLAPESVVDPLSASELERAWSRELQPATGSYHYRGACSSPSGDLLVVALATATRGESTLTLFRLDAGATILRREPTLSDQRGPLYPVGGCVSTGEGFLLLGNRGARVLEGVWLKRDLTPVASRTLVDGPRPQILAVTAIEKDRFAAVGHDDWTTHLVVFDRENVKHIVPAWDPDQAVAAFDLVSAGDAVTFCGVEGGRGGDPIDARFVDAHLVVASFGLDGKERGAARFPGILCRLFRDAGGGIVMLRMNSSDPLAGSSFVRLDRDLRESDPRPGPRLSVSALGLWVEAVQLGSSFVVLEPASIDGALHLIEPDSTSRMGLDASAGSVIRSGGNRVYRVSHWYPEDATGNGIRIEAFDLVGAAP